MPCVPPSRAEYCTALKGTSVSGHSVLPSVTIIISTRLAAKDVVNLMGGDGRGVVLHDLEMGVMITQPSAALTLRLGTGLHVPAASEMCLQKNQKVRNSTMAPSTYVQHVATHVAPKQLGRPPPLLACSTTTSRCRPRCILMSHVLSLPYRQAQQTWTCRQTLHAGRPRSATVDLPAPS